MKKHTLARLSAILALACLKAAADPLTIAGKPVELALSQITDRTIRIEIFPLDPQGKPKPYPPSLVMGKFASKEELRLRDLDAPKDVQIGKLKVSLKAAPLTITLHNAAGKLVQELVFDAATGAFTFHTEAPTFGLGEGRQQFDRRGFYYNFQNGQNILLATHGATVPVPFLFGADGWGMFIHNPQIQTGNAQNDNIAWGQFDLRGENAGPAPAARGNARPNITPPEVLPTRGRFIPRPDTLNQAPTQIYLMALDQPADALGEYTYLFGNAAMPPKWTMGYMQSHRSLQDSAEVLAVAQRFRDDKLPCDALIYLGTGYTISTRAIPSQPGSGKLGGWNIVNGSLEFNPDVFDKPQEMIDKLHAENFKIIMHKTNAPAGLFGDVHDQSTARNNIAAYWNTHVPLMKMGVDAWWPDDGDELPIENRLVRIKAYFDGPLKDFPNQRPWSLSRNGYAGVAKYGAWLWSGDVVSTWATLAAHVPDGVQYSMSVAPFWGTDIGGFNGSPEYSGELYTRWFEFGAFNALFRSHGRNWHLHTPFGWDAGGPGPQESTLPAAGTDYHMKEVEPICKTYLELRYQLLPYNYTLTREACDTGMPLMRALLLAYPRDSEAVSLGNEYLWGPSILVAPVVEKGATTRAVYLPKGGWYDYWTGEKADNSKVNAMMPVKHLVEGQWVQRKVDLATMPIYVKAGAILPMDPIRQFTAEKVTDPTTLKIYPGADGTFTLYDDDGKSQDYLTNTDAQTEWIKFTWNDAARTLSIDPDARMKQLPGGTRTFKVQAAGSHAPPAEIQFTGKHMEIKLP